MAPSQHASYPSQTPLGQSHSSDPSTNPSPHTVLVLVLVPLTVRPPTHSDPSAISTHAGSDGVLYSLPLPGA